MIDLSPFLNLDLNDDAAVDAAVEAAGAQADEIIRPEKWPILQRSKAGRFVATLIEQHDDAFGRMLARAAVREIRRRRKRAERKARAMRRILEIG